VLLQPSGFVHVTEGVLQVHLQVDFQRFVTSCEQLSDRISTVSSKIDDNDYWVSHWRTDLNTFLEHTCRDIKTWPVLFSQQFKRQIGAVLSGIFGSFGGFAMDEILHHLFHSGVEDRVSGVDHRLQLLTKTVRDLTMHLRGQEGAKAMATFNELRITLLQHRSDLFRFTDSIMYTIITNRLSPVLLPLQELLKVWDSVAKYALQHQLPFSLDPESLLELPCTVEYVNATTLDLTITVPFSHAPAILFRAADFPLVLPAHNAPVTIQNNDFLAVSDAHRGFWVFPNQDLSHCFRLHHHAFCSAPVTFLSAADHCLAAVHDGLWDAVLSVCLFSEARGNWSVMHGQGGFYVYTSAPRPFQIKCDNGTVLNSQWTEGSHRMDIPESCSVFSAAFNIDPLRHFSLIPFVFHYDWQLVTVEDTAQRLKKKIMHPLSVQEIQEYQHSTEGAAIWICLGLLSLAVFGLYVFFIIILYIYCRFGKVPT